MATISPNTRLRPSPFYAATVAEGVTSFSPYNMMAMPVSYGNPRAEYDRLVNGAAMWDVAVERQVEINGPDAGDLVQILCARDLSALKFGKGLYVPMCDHRGVLVNDPVVLKLEDQKYWLSIADNNMLMWARGIGLERGMDVTLHEPDVSPLAVQGPKAEDVVAALLGDQVRDIRYFGFDHAEVNGIPLLVQRSGYSKQGGFELYLRNGARGVELWNLVQEAGQPFGIGPGAPNPSERIQSGLLSYGGDTDDETNPFEVRLDAYTSTHLPNEVVGMAALKQIKAEGPKRQQLGLILSDTSNHEDHDTWYPVAAHDGQIVGSMTNCTWSFALEAPIGFILVDQSVKADDQLTLNRKGRLMTGRAVNLPFV